MYLWWSLCTLYPPPNPPIILLGIISIYIFAKECVYMTGTFCFIDLITVETLKTLQTSFLIIIFLILKINNV